MNRTLPAVSSLLLSWYQETFAGGFPPILQVSNSASLSFIVWLRGPSMINGGPDVKSVVTTVVLDISRTILMFVELFSHTSQYIAHHTSPQPISSHPIPPNPSSFHPTSLHRSAPQPITLQQTTPYHTTPHLISMICSSGIYRWLVPITRKNMYTTQILLHLTLHRKV